MPRVESAAEAPPKTTANAVEKAAPAWPQWRGPERDGRAVMLPAALPASPRRLWTVPLSHSGLGGVAADAEMVVIGDRDALNISDVLRAYHPRTGELLWEHSYPAPGELDYGASPRATPLIGKDLVFLQGAFGHVTAVAKKTGEAVWQRDTWLEFDVAKQPEWGACSSLLLADGLLILNPGAPQASLVAVRPETGKVVWKSPGGHAGHGSLIVATLGGKRQIVGFDRESLGGWEVATGRRLWKVDPLVPGDFNVPTPVVWNGQLVVATENNGARLYRFNSEGRIVAQPFAENPILSPDMSSPVVVGDRLFCVWRELYCLDLKQGLRDIFIGRDRALGDFGACIADGQRILAVGRGGELLLLDAAADAMRVVSRAKVFPNEESEQYSHPALVGTRLYIRGERSLAAVDLAAE